MRDCDLRNDHHTNEWNRCSVQPCRAWAWSDSDVCVRRYVLSFLRHRADVCADRRLIERGVVWRSTDVQQSPVPCAGAANEWWGDCVHFESRCGLDSNVYVRYAIHALFRIGAHVQSDGIKRCWHVERR